MDQSTESRHLSGPRACTTCAKAKVKCIPPPSGGLCDRCRRLKKPCFSQTPTPRRKRPKKPTPKKLSRLEILERRVEELSSRLDLVDGGDMVNMTSNSRGPVVDETDSDGRSTPESDSEEDDEEPIVDGESSNSDNEIWEKPDSESTQSVPATVLTADEEAVRLVTLYREEMQHRFPFVVVPPELSDAEHRTKRPFLWRAVKMSAIWRERPRHFRLGRKLLRDLTDAVLSNSQKSLDILQGLLVLISWYHWKLDKSHLANILGLVQSLCSSLNLNQNIRNCLKVHTQDMSDGLLEQARAYCGWYYLSAIYFTFNEQPELCPQLMFSEELYAKLSSQESPHLTDRRLVFMVQLTKIMQDTVVQMKNRELMRGLSTSLSTVMVIFYNKISKLKIFMRDQDNSFSQTEIDIAEIMVARAAVSDPYLRPQADQETTSDHREKRATDGSSKVVEETQARTEYRIDFLNKCLVAINRFLLHRLMSHDVYKHLTYMSSFDMTYCLDVFDHTINLPGLPGWNRNEAKKRMDLGPEFLEGCIKHIKVFTAENSAAVSSHSICDGRDEEEDLDLEDTKKHPFDRIEEDINYFYRIMWSKLYDTNIFIPFKMPGKDGRGREGKPITKKEEEEAYLARAALMRPPTPPPSAPTRRRAPSKKAHVSMAGTGASSSTSEASTPNSESFPSSVFPQISFWPRMLERE